MLKAQKIFGGKNAVNHVPRFNLIEIIQTCNRRLTSITR